MVWTATNSKSGNEKFFKLTVSTCTNPDQPQMQARPITCLHQLSCPIACFRTSSHRVTAQINCRLIVLLFACVQGHGLTDVQHLLTLFRGRELEMLKYIENRLALRPACAMP